MNIDWAFDIMGLIVLLVCLTLVILILIIRTVVILNKCKVKLTKRIKNGCRTSEVQKQRMGNLSHSIRNIFVRSKGSRIKQLPEKETIETES